MSKNWREWSSLVDLAVMLCEGKADLEELVANSSSGVGVVDDGKKRGRIGGRRKASSISVTNYFKKPTVSFKKTLSGRDQKINWNWGGFKKPRSGYGMVSNFGVVDDCDKKRGRIESLKPSSLRNFKKPIEEESAGGPSEEEMKKWIVDCGGDVERAVLVIDKELFESDVDSGKARLSMPHRQVTDPKQFLRKEEWAELKHNPKGKGIPVTVFGRAAVCSMRFKNWSSNKQYALNKTSARPMDIRARLPLFRSGLSERLMTAASVLLSLIIGLSEV